MTSQEQIDKECDALIKKYNKATTYKYQEYAGAHPSTFEHDKETLIELAILHQTVIVEMLEKLIGDLNLFDKEDMNVICHKLTIAKQILETLKSRIK